MHQKYKKINYLTARTKGGVLRIDLPEFNSSYLSAATANIHNHIFFELKRSSFPKESEIFEVKRSGDTIGFVIPGAALCSTAHAYAKNRMFGPFAYLAICNAVMLEEAKGITQSASSLEDVIRQDIFYAVINCEKLPAKTKDSFLDLFFPAFLDFGFFDANSNQAPLLDLEFDDEITKKKKSTILLHGEIPTTPFVRKILFDLIPYEKNPFFAFFYAWQVVEYLMQTEFEKRFTNFIEKHKDSHQIVDFRNALDKLNEFSKEKNKIFAILGGMDANLCASIDQLYLKVSPPKGTDSESTSHASDDDETEESSAAPAKLYRIRNLMFHSLVSLDSFDADVRELINLFWIYLQNKCWNRNERPQAKVIFHNRATP